MERQAVLERLGWRFIRIRGSEYYRNPTEAMERVVAELTSYGIEPTISGGDEDGIALRNSDLLERVRAGAHLDESSNDELSQRSREAAIQVALREDGSRNAPFGLEPMQQDTAVRKLSQTPSSTTPQEEPRESLLAANARREDHRAIEKPTKAKPGRKTAKKDSGKKQIDEEAGRAKVKKNGSQNPDSKHTAAQQTLHVDSTTRRKQGKDKAYDAIAGDLQAAGLEYVDKRTKGGALWVVGGRDIDFTLKDVAKKYGVKFEYLPKGGKATKGRSGYYMVGQPKVVESEGEKSIRASKSSPVKATKKAAAAKYRQAYEQAALPFTPLPDAEDYDRSAYKGAIEKRMKTLLEIESPIERQRMFNLVRESFGVKRSGSYIQAHNERILRRIDHKTTSFGKSTFIWRSDQKPGSYDKYRPNENGVTRSANEIPFEEILAAMSEVLERRHEVERTILIEKAAKRFGYKRAAKRIIEVFDMAINEGVRRGKLDESKNGQIRLA